VDQGTGLVHIAPGHGEEDYELGKSLGLKIYNPVDDAGRFAADVEHFAGLTVWDANPKIIEHLKSVGMLIAQRPLDHTYPHCWRCKNPTLFRATEQWFIDLNKGGFRAAALEAIKRDIQWIPPWGEDRIHNMVAHRLEWVISRQRVWGVPIVAFYCTNCETLLLEERIVEHVATIFRQGRGGDEWYAREARDLLPPGTRCAKCNGESFRKETDILDVWFDSGCSHAAVLETRPELHWPAELYLEGSDQHRGWFQSSLLESIGTRDAPPYKSVVTHGFFVDGEGRKMSKSLGNVISLDEVLPKFGAEVLRLWVAAEDYTQDIRVSMEILDRLADAYRRMRNTFRFLLGNLGDFDPARDRQSSARLDEVDRWVLDRLARLIARVGAPTTSTSSTPSSTPCIISARSICRRSISTSSRTGSTPRCPTIRGGARRRPCASTSSVRSRGSWRPSSRSRPRKRGATCPASTARACTSSGSPTPRGTGSTTRSSATGTGCSRCAARWPRRWRPREPRS
jgi:isoleucyl-tRNA synthetase